MSWKDSDILRAVLHNAEAGATADGHEIAVLNAGLLTLHAVAASSWDGTLNFEATIDGNWVVLQGENVSNGTLITTAAGTTLNALFRFDITGFQSFRARITGRTTGTVTVTARGVPV